MKFTLERKALVKMLKMVSVGGAARHAHLWIPGQGDQLILTVEDFAGTNPEKYLKPCIVIDPRCAESYLS
jgi:hypothetical protein